jgi:hypothetical protein
MLSIGGLGSATDLRNPNDGLRRCVLEIQWCTFPTIHDSVMKWSLQNDGDLGQSINSECWVKTSISIQSIFMFVAFHKQNQVRKMLVLIGKRIPLKRMDWRELIDNSCSSHDMSKVTTVM